MQPATNDELEKAHVVIASLISKCEKAKVNLEKGQLTLMENRIKALTISLDLIDASLTKSA